MLHPNGFWAFPVSSCNRVLRFAGRSAQWTVAPGFSRIWLADFRFLGHFAHRKASESYFFRVGAGSLVLGLRCLQVCISWVLLLRWAGEGTMMAAPRTEIADSRCFEMILQTHRGEKHQQTKTPADKKHTRQKHQQTKKPPGKITAGQEDKPTKTPANENTSKQ